MMMASHGGLLVVYATGPSVTFAAVDRSLIVPLYASDCIWYLTAKMTIERVVSVDLLAASKACVIWWLFESVSD